MLQSFNVIGKTQLVWAIGKSTVFAVHELHGITDITLVNGTATHQRVAPQREE